MMMVITTTFMANLALKFHDNVLSHADETRYKYVFSGLVIVNQGRTGSVGSTLLRVGLRSTMIGLSLKQKQKQTKNQQTCKKKKLYKALLASRAFTKHQRTQRHLLFFLKHLSSIWLTLLVPHFSVCIKWHGGHLSLILGTWNFCCFLHLRQLQIDGFQQKRLS